MRTYQNKQYGCNPKNVPHVLSLLFCFMLSKRYTISITFNCLPCFLKNMGPTTVSHMYFLFPTLSFASSLIINTLDDGTVLAKVQTAYEPKRIIALLNDPQKMSKIDGEIEVSILQIFDNCKDIQYTIPKLLWVMLKNITFTKNV